MSKDKKKRQKKIIQNTYEKKKTHRIKFLI